MAKMIDGAAYKSMILAAAQAVEERRDEINALNVFPVPDGDTGTNMSLTLANAARELAKLEAPNLGRAAEVTSGALLRGARGNSGVITSLIFRGMTKRLKDLTQADGMDLAEAIVSGADTAYKAVMKPAEGTMLTVCRVCGEAAVKAAKKNRDAEHVLSKIIEAGKKALEETTEQNPVLKKAGVIDAGAFGLLISFGAMQLALGGKLTQLAAKFMPTSVKAISVQGVDFSQFDGEEITFAYCTEFLVEKKDRRRSVEKLRQFLNSIGDSVVVVDDEQLIKVHVHTDDPDKALGAGLRHGGLSAIKIENMVEQLARNSLDSVEANMGKRAVAAPEKKFGFVAVAAGAGVCDVFRDLGADEVVEGGQTMNPSTEDLLRAIDRVPAEVVFVMPNNKNIIMSANQAVELSSKQVIVIPSKTVPQGISAVLAFEELESAQKNTQLMTAALSAVHSGAITYAVRDSEFDGKRIRQGDFLALEENRLLDVGRTALDTARRLARSMCKKGASYITVFYGEGADEAQAKAVAALFEAECKGAEVNVIFGGQPVYSYLFSVE